MEEVTKAESHSIDQVLQQQDTESSVVSKEDSLGNPVEPQEPTQPMETESTSTADEDQVNGNHTEEGPGPRDDQAVNGQVVGQENPDQENGFHPKNYEFHEESKPETAVKSESEEAGQDDPSMDSMKHQETSGPSSQECCQEEEGSHEEVSQEEGSQEEGSQEEGSQAEDSQEESIEDDASFTLDLSVKKTKLEPMDGTDISLKQEDQEEPLSLSNKIDNHLANGVLTNGDIHAAVEMEDESLEPRLKELSREEVLAREKKIRKLKARLRHEEMKLVLMKKIKLSQMVKENVSGSSSTQSGSLQSHKSSSSSSSSSLSQQQLLQQLQQQHGIVPSAHGSKSTHQTNATPAHMPRAAHERSSRGGSSVFNPPIPPSIHGSRSGIHGMHHHGPPAGMTSSRGAPPQGMPAPAHSSHRSSGGGRHIGNGPPNVVMGFPVHELKVQASQPPSRSSPPVERMSMEQKKQQAKLQLRKQLEKQLLQIPPPKPPPPEMHFIPNANNTEFVYYLGLESVVDLLTQSPNMNKPPPEPFECSQCGTDFTPVWKWQELPDPKAGGLRPAVICEGCVSHNLKKALRIEHTSRLKKAFVSAVHQEQELEAKIAAGTLSPPTVVSPTPQPSMRDIVSSSNFDSREERSLLNRREHHSNNHHDSSLNIRHRSEQVRDHHHSRVREERESSRHRREQQQREREALVQQQEHLAQLASVLQQQGLGIPGIIPPQQQPPAAHSSRSFREDRRSRGGNVFVEDSPSSSSSSRHQQQDQAAAAAAAAANANVMAAAMQQLTAANNLMANMSKMTPVQQQAMLLQAQQLLSGLGAGGLPGLGGAAPFLFPFGMMGGQGTQSSSGKANQSNANAAAAAASLLPGLNMTPEQLQRQFLLDLIPGARGQTSGNWKQ